MPLRRLVALLAALAWFGAAQAQMPAARLRSAWCARRARRSPRHPNSSAASRQWTALSLTARVTAFLEQRLFIEGTEVKAGDLLYRLERAPFEAAVAQQGPPSPMPAPGSPMPISN